MHSAAAAADSRDADCAELDALLHTILQSQVRPNLSAEVEHDRRLAGARWRVPRRQRPDDGSHVWDSLMREPLAVLVRPARQPARAVGAALGQAARRPPAPALTVAHSATGSVVEKMPDLSAYDCPVCMGALTRTNVSVLYPCLHRYCYGCIRRWLKLKLACPLCKVEPTELLYSIRSSLDFRVKALRAGAAACPPHPARQSCSATLRARDEGGTHIALQNAPLAPQPADVPPIVSAADALPLGIPVARVSIDATGAIVCSVEETNRARALLGLPPLTEAPALPASSAGAAASTNAVLLSASTTRASLSLPPSLPASSALAASAPELAAPFMPSQQAPLQRIKRRRGHALCGVPSLSSPIFSVDGPPQPAPHISAFSTAAGPIVRMTQLPDGSWHCTVAETNRVRAALGLRLLREWDEPAAKRQRALGASDGGALVCGATSSKDRGSSNSGGGGGGGSNSGGGSSSSASCCVSRPLHNPHSAESCSTARLTHTHECPSAPGLCPLARTRFVPPAVSRQLHPLVVRPHMPVPEYLTLVPSRATSVLAAAGSGDGSSSGSCGNGAGGASGVDAASSGAGADRASVHAGSANEAAPGVECASTNA